MDTQLLKIIRIALSAILIIVSFWYSIRSYLKYQEGIISISNHKEFPGDEIDFPKVTICPGFRDAAQKPESMINDANGDNSLDPVEFLGTKSKGLTRMLVKHLSILGPDKIKQLSYNRTEIFTYFWVTYADGKSFDVKENSSVWTETFHEYFFGNCHTFHPTSPTKAGEVYAISIGLQVE